MTTPTQQIEAAAHECCEQLNYAYLGIVGEVDPKTVAILLKFAAQLMQTGAMKGVEEALEISSKYFSGRGEVAFDNGNETKADNLFARASKCNDALASISALKGLGEDK
jgi:hypothetical protein